MKVDGRVGTGDEVRPGWEVERTAACRLELRSRSMPLPPPFLALLSLLTLLAAVARRRAGAGRGDGAAATAAARGCLHHLLLSLLHINQHRHS